MEEVRLSGKIGVIYQKRAIDPFRFDECSTEINDTALYMFTYFEGV
jgi:hypothetical protein